jgi:S1-C subfamily serine protease
VAVDAIQVLSIRDLLNQITLRKPGDQVEISIYRGPRQLTLQMLVTQRPQ